MSALRSNDPGTIVSSYCGRIWVECPKCRNAAFTAVARPDAYKFEIRLNCTSCGYVTNSETLTKERIASASLAGWRPRCFNCGRDLEKYANVHALVKRGNVVAKVRCKGCLKVGEYPAAVGRKSSNVSEGREGDFNLPLYLTERIGENLLWVVNLDHLDAIEEWLGADLRSRSERGGMTMMARLPLWMKKAAMRPKILKAAQRLRTKAAKAGIH